MTIGPKMPFLMQTVLKNIDVRGLNNGLAQGIQDMVDFIKSEKIHPVVSRVLQADLDDLAGIDGLFEDMKHGKQFGKLVIEFGKSNNESKLWRRNWHLTVWARSLSSKTLVQKISFDTLKCTLLGYI